MTLLTDSQLHDYYDADRRAWLAGQFGATEWAVDVVGNDEVTDGEAGGPLTEERARTLASGVNELSVRLHESGDAPNLSMHAVVLHHGVPVLPERAASGHE